MEYNDHITSGILTIQDSNPTNLNLFNKYRHFTASEIHVHAANYVNADTRQMQNKDQLYHFLNNSLTAYGTANIIVESTKYHIGSNLCGALLFKLNLQKSSIDTRAIASNMRENLSSLDMYIVTVKYEI